jgi:IclR family acetate operon transcriptional repressor
MPKPTQPIRPARPAQPPAKPSRQAARGRTAAAGAGHTQALSRGLALLDALAATDGGATLTAIATQLGLPAPTAHRLLSTLEQAGYVQQGHGGKWQVGVRAFRAGSAFLDHRDLVVAAYPHLERLMDAAGETTNLAVVDDGEAVFVLQVQCRELMRMSTKLGARAPLHASGVGNAMLAAMPGPAVAAVLAQRGLVRHTARTLTSRTRLAAELAASRRRGYAIDDEEHAAGLRCVAAAVWDENGEPWAAISIAGPVSRIAADRVATLGRLVRSVADDITAALGGHPPRS